MPRSTTALLACAALALPFTAAFAQAKPTPAAPKPAVATSAKTAPGAVKASTPKPVLPAKPAAASAPKPTAPVGATAPKPAATPKPAVAPKRVAAPKPAPSGRLVTTKTTTGKTITYNCSKAGNANKKACK